MPNTNRDIKRLLQVFRRTPNGQFMSQIGARHRIQYRRNQVTPFQQIIDVQGSPNTDAIFQHPLVHTNQTFNRLPIRPRRVFRVIITPLHQHNNPNRFRATNSNIKAFTNTRTILPTGTLLLGPHHFQFDTSVINEPNTINFARNIATNSRHRNFFVIRNRTTRNFTGILNQHSQVKVTFQTFQVRMSRTRLRNNR